jgi:tight adherence protein C
MLISYLCVLVLCQLAGAKTEPILLGVFGFFVYVYWLYQEDKRTLHRQQERADQELPSIVEMFSILVSAGESPASALMKISGVARGVFPAQIQKITQNLQNGGNLKSSLEDLSLQSDSLSIRRFCDSLIISIERGTSLSDVLSRQVEEIRSGQKANLLRQAGKVEIALMIPVVFVILPISILFALWPSYVALGQSII